MQYHMLSSRAYILVGSGAVAGDSAGVALWNLVDV